jgi:hypothetical protein
VAEGRGSWIYKIRKKNNLECESVVQCYKEETKIESSKELPPLSTLPCF